MKKGSDLVYMLSCLLGVSSLALAQPKVSLRLSFNAEQNRYEVFAQPNFSAKNFSWGPSQISVVTPQSVSDERLSVRSTNVGSWADNSAVYAPAAAPMSDYHGMTTNGSKLDLIAGEDYLLFDFTLKGGYVENVRLYDTTVDPGSERPGMRGGDFRSYMSDERGADYLQIDNRAAVLTVKAQDAGSELQTDVQLIAYPNPVAGGKFRLYLKGFDAKELVTVRLLSLNGAVLRSFNESVESLGGRVIDAGELTESYLLLNLERQVNRQVFTHKLWFR